MFFISTQIGFLWQFFGDCTIWPQYASMMLVPPTSLIPHTSHCETVHWESININAVVKKKKKKLKSEIQFFTGLSL